jgi:hypothetical protein
LTETPITVKGAWLNSLPIERRIDVLKGPFGRQMHEWAASHVSYFWWIRTSLLGTTVSNNASIFFLCIGDVLLGVTAAHVYQGYLDARKKSPGHIVCRIGNLEFDPESRLRGLGLRDRIDIATFALTWDELKVIGKQAISVDPSGWPPPHPFSGQATFLLGFPGKSRLWLNPHAISFGLFIGLQHVGTASDRSITCPFERECWVDIMGRGLIPEGFDLGGISGGPLLLPMEAHGSWSMSVGGVISEAPSRGFETVVSTPAHFIAVDGTINDGRSAPVLFAVPS